MTVREPPAPPVDRQIYRHVLDENRTALVHPEKSDRIIPHTREELKILRPGVRPSTAHRSGACLSTSPASVWPEPCVLRVP